MLETYRSKLAKLDISKKRIAELQDTLVAKGEQAGAFGAQMRKELERRSVLAAGRARDVSLERIYEAGESGLSTAAELLDRVAADRPEAEKLRKGAAASAEARAALHNPPLEGYDNLTVAEVSASLDGLSVYQLDKVRRYEVARKNRVTLLREIDERIG